MNLNLQNDSKLDVMGLKLQTSLVFPVICTVNPSLLQKTKSFLDNILWFQDLSMAWKEFSF